MPIDVEGSEITNTGQVWGVISLMAMIYRFSGSDQVMLPDHDQLVEERELTTSSPTLFSPGTILDVPAGCYISLRVRVTDATLLPRHCVARMRTGANLEYIHQEGNQLMWNVNGYQTCYFTVTHPNHPSFHLHAAGITIMMDLTFVHGTDCGPKITLMWPIIMNNVANIKGEEVDVANIKGEEVHMRVDETARATRFHRRNRVRDV